MTKEITVKTEVTYYETVCGRCRFKYNYKCILYEEDLEGGADTWTYYFSPQDLYENLKGLFDNYKRKKQNVEHQSTQTRKWRGINCRNRRES